MIEKAAMVAPKLMFQRLTLAGPLGKACSPFVDSVKDASKHRQQVLSKWLKVVGET